MGKGEERVPPWAWRLRGWGGASKLPSVIFGGWVVSARDLVTSVHVPPPSTIRRTPVVKHIWVYCLKAVTWAGESHTS